MTLTELNEKINSFKDANGFKYCTLYIMVDSWGKTKTTKYSIDVRGRKETPKKLEAKGESAEWCLQYLETQFKWLTEEQKPTDIELK